jgi:acetyl-CoA acetyltransferase
MSIQHLHLPYEKVNPVGGAIALGHPLGCTGARQVATALSEAKREKKKIFVTSMCIGSGMVSLAFLSSFFVSPFSSSHLPDLAIRYMSLERS